MSRLPLLDEKGLKNNDLALCCATQPNEAFHELGCQLTATVELIAASIEGIGFSILGRLHIPVPKKSRLPGSAEPKFPDLPNHASQE